MIDFSDGPGLIAKLRANALLPDSFHCVYAAGSLVRGWGNTTSDVDLYVITDDEPPRTVTTSHPVALSPDAVPVAATYVDSVRWDVEYWQGAQVDQVLEKVSWSRYEEAGARESLTGYEADFFVKLQHSVPLAGAEHHAELKRRLDGSAHRVTMVGRALNYADIFAEDCLGQLESGDETGAVITAKLSFTYAVEALLAHHGEFGTTPKWRVQQLGLANPKVLPFDKFWEIETMRNYDPDAPGEWSRGIIRLVRDICLEVEV
ncbi:hypothetical protein ACIBAG_31420 [Streptomyces sp. NPDC051243]|uniref:hypothetical protein n=1 Tax=Streptomyces sp. NPDC051243 TaxID=3365646 RepID=UPI0037AD604D